MDPNMESTENGVVGKQPEKEKEEKKMGGITLFVIGVIAFAVGALTVIMLWQNKVGAFKDTFTASTDITNNPVEPHPAVSPPQAAPKPKMDHNSMLLSSVADPELVRRQNEWADDVTKYSGGTRIDSDVIDMESTINFQGLRRPEAPPVSPNALFVTEITPADLMGNVGISF